MLRVAIPYGTLSSDQLRALAFVARRYDKGYGHFTTRQNIQFNWIKLEETPDLLHYLAKNKIHGIQTSGNVIRNVTSDHFAGATVDEVEDPRIYAEIIRQWSTLHPEFTFLPRKFKIAVISSNEDRAATRFHDIGLILHNDVNGKKGFEVIVGGGMGRTPVIGTTIKNFLPKEDLISYLEAILRVYNRYGRRDNIYKARIKILVRELGVDAFKNQVEQEWLVIDRNLINHSQGEETRIREMFKEPDFYNKTFSINNNHPNEPDFQNWLKSNIYKHKNPDFRIVSISLKPIGGIPGDATAEQMDLVADLAQKYSFDEIRVSHEQNLILPHVHESELGDLWISLRKAKLATPNSGFITDMIACPGLDYCSLANARSIPVAQSISNKFKDIAKQYDIGNLKIKISGCINACGHHHAGHIGLLGVDRNGEEFYQITLGGSGEDDASIGKIIGPGFSKDKIVEAVELIVQVYLENRSSGETFLSFYRREGAKPFKESLYGSV